MRTTTAGWEAVIGLEVHVQLRTATKLFCACRNAYGEAPNSLTCPVCLGLPGSLPVLNQVQNGSDLIKEVKKCLIAGSRQETA